MNDLPDLEGDDLGAIGVAGQRAIAKRANDIYQSALEISCFTNAQCRELARFQAAMQVAYIGLDAVAVAFNHPDAASLNDTPDQGPEYDQ